MTGTRTDIGTTAVRDGGEPEAERELIRRAKEGDEKAFAELVRRHEQMLYGFAFKVCRNRDAAEETLQDTFVNVYRKLKQFDGKSKLSTWMYSIVTNNCLMKRRKSKLEKNAVSIEDMEQRAVSAEERAAAREEMLVLTKTPLQESVASELRDHLDTAIQKLPVEYRLVFILRDVEGTSAAETAEIMKLTIPAVKSRLRRARVFLKEQLQEYMTS